LDAAGRRKYENDGVCFDDHMSKLCLPIFAARTGSPFSPRSRRSPGGPFMPGLPRLPPVTRADARIIFSRDERCAVDVLPADAKPPLDLNKETMERYRPEMSKFYLNKPVRFN
jgi:hypothetical protein